MTHTITQTEEFEEEYCDACNHPVSMHYNDPKNVYDLEGNYIYTAEGCMALSGLRKLKGNNIYSRCKCLHAQ